MYHRPLRDNYQLQLQPTARTAWQQAERAGFSETLAFIRQRLQEQLQGEVGRQLTDAEMAKWAPGMKKVAWGAKFPALEPGKAHADIIIVFEYQGIDTGLVLVHGVMVAAPPPDSP